MTMKEIAKKIIASINPGNEDISDISNGTIKGAIRKFADGILSTLEEIDANTDETAVSGAPAVKELNKNMNALSSNGAITGMRAGEDGVYITYVPSDGADPVSKKLGSGGPYSVALALTTGGAATVSVEIDGQEVITYSQPSSTAYGRQDINGTFTPTD